MARGVAGKVAGGAWSGLGKIKDNLSSKNSDETTKASFSTENEATNPSDYGDEEQRETKENNSGQHPESPNTKSKKETNPFSKNSVPNSRESVKDIENLSDKPMSEANRAVGVVAPPKPKLTSRYYQIADKLLLLYRCLDDLSSHYLQKKYIYFRGIKSLRFS